MKPICVFTPTRLHGIDVTYYSLMRQTLREDIEWVIIDEFWDERADTIRELSMQAPFPIHHYRVPMVPGNPRNLTAAYNLGLALARAMGADLFVSLQDYIWIPDNGIEMFVEMADLYPGHLLTGLCSWAGDPGPGFITNPKGMFTIFDKPYRDEPKNIVWHDVRNRELERYTERGYLEWETNWAAITRGALYELDLNFDEEYDKGVAYENQGYAFDASLRGAGVWLDQHNHAISLPHKDYWPEIEQREGPLTHANRAFHDARCQKILGQRGAV